MDYSGNRQEFVLHILLLIQGAFTAVDVILASVVFFPLALVYEHFHKQCLLYSKLRVKKDVNNTILIQGSTKYGDAYDCNYTVYVNVCLVICSIILMWFLLHSKFYRESKSLIKLLGPMFLFKLVFFICITIASVKISDGVSSFCSFLESNNITNNDKSFRSCYQYEDLTWKGVNGSDFYTNLLTSEITSYILVVFLGVECLLTMVSLYLDIRVQTDSSGSQNSSGHSDKDYLCGAEADTTSNQKQNISQSVPGDTGNRDDIGPSENSGSHDRTLVDVHGPPELGTHHSRSTPSLD